MEVSSAVNLQDVQGAASRIESEVHHTPVMTCESLDVRAGRKLHFKCECLQKIGAFKIRGATNFVKQLSDDAVSHGVVTHSSGNHAQAVALAAQRRGVPAYIVMPEDSVAIKQQAVKDLGGTITLCAPTVAAREATAAALIEQTGGVLVPPYDHPHIIAGQGTVALELTGAVDDLDAIVAPIGGGGLLGGTSVVCRGSQRPLRVFGAEPKGADDAARSLEAGELIPVENPQTICDGLRVSMGPETWPLIRDNVEKIFRVTDEDAIGAMRFVWERMKLLIEPSSAVAVAVVLSDEFGQLEGLERVGVILSGGNVDLDRLPWMS
jgi:threonine dehydratase/serine racemase